ncbi:4'-phosphopantetheinyl transferase family protein [Taibaiella koreensis]|uniref:4'-phosphopantetheinyl transferase family protein n=1 Tax=Taibaiella koreensis TaxID=1268548 RepID=UPI000E59D0FA|nr:4'-phosphopantetheinyl transferase superfamily protein [Taibaiella koreensis]
MVLVLYTFFSDAAEDDIAFERLLLTLPVTFHEVASRYKRSKNRWAFLLGKLLIQRGFAALGLSGSYTLSDLAYTAYNKPFIPGGVVDFNIAHSEYCVVCALSTTCRLGIDIECIHPVETDAYYSIMTDEERLDIKRSDDKLTHFYRYWTAKESVLKANGKGLNIPLQSFSIKDKQTQLEHTHWFLNEIPIPGNYICHLATNDQMAASTISLHKEVF